MKPSLLLCLLTLFILATFLAACTTNDSGEDFSPATSPVSNTVRPSPEPTTTTTSSATTTEPVNSETPTVSSTVPTLTDEAITIPPLTTPEEPTTTAPVTTVPIPTPPPVTTLPAQSIDPAVHWVADCDDYITLRTYASTGAPAIIRIPVGESMELLGFTGTFAKVNYRGLTGYVLASYISRPDGYGTDEDLTVVKPVQNYSYAQMQADLAVLADKFPSLFTLSSIGKSEEGRDLTLCILGNPQAEHRIFMQASIHGREHIVSLLAMSEIDYILHHPDMEISQGITIGELLSQVAIHIVPMSNPDGVTISQTGVLPKAFKNRYPASVATKWKANAKGVDLNANFDADWHKYQSIYESTSPAYAGYKGTSPECAAESKALADYLRANRFDLILSYHTSGSLIYWSYDTKNHPEVNALNHEIATSLSQQNGFPLDTPGATSTAGLSDWTIQSLGIPSLTIEFAISTAPAPIREYEQIWARGKHTLLTSALWVTGLNS